MKSTEEIMDRYGFEATFTYEESKTDPAYAEFASAGESRGTMFEFEEGEAFSFPKEIRFFGKHVKIGGKAYAQVFTMIESDIRGEIPMPIAIVRRVPALPEEITILKKNNTIGSAIIEQMPDIKRILVMSRMLKAGQKIQTTPVVLHTHRFVNGERIEDRADMEESKRKSITCYKFNAR